MAEEHVADGAQKRLGFDRLGAGRVVAGPQRSPPILGPRIRADGNRRYSPGRALGPALDQSRTRPCPAWRCRRRSAHYARQRSMASTSRARLSTESHCTTCAPHRLENHIQQLARVSLVIDDEGHRCTVQTQLDVADSAPPCVAVAFRLAPCEADPRNRPAAESWTAVPRSRPWLCARISPWCCSTRWRAIARPSPEASVSARRWGCRLVETGRRRRGESLPRCRCLCLEPRSRSLRPQPSRISLYVFAAAFRSEFRRIGHDVAEDLMEPFWSPSIEGGAWAPSSRAQLFCLGVGAWQRAADDRNR